MKRSLRLSPVMYLSSLVGDGELVAFNVGPEQVVYLVIALRPLDYRFVSSMGSSFAKTIPDRPQDYRVIGLYGSQIVFDLVIEHERYNIHDIQPLVDELLLVCARSYYFGPDNFEKNGRVYTLDGKLTREILLGDGIETVQSTSNGVIWTSYFDEGIGGTFGWQSPIGASGLVAWDSTGNKLYEFEQRNGLDWIIDCYALNVESEQDVWFYYYTEFALVHLHRREIQSVWKINLRGSHAFAISHGYAFFSGSYDDRDTFHLFGLGNAGNFNLIAEIELQDEEGKKMRASRVVGRAASIYLVNNDTLYQVDVQTAIDG